jgi:hypothetical protein
MFWTLSIALFYQKTETESISETLCFEMKTGRWIMSRNIIFVLMYHRHKLLDFINENLFSGYMKACVGSRSSVVGIATGYGLDYRGVGVREFSLFQVV